MANLVEIGFVAETGQIVVAERRLDDLARAGNRVDSSNQRVQRSTNETNQALGGMSRRAGQVGVQLEQLAGQTAVTGNFLQAFAFQAADIGIVLGQPLIGAIIGVSSTLTSVLISALSETEEELRQISDLMPELIDDFNRLSERGQAASRGVIALSLQRDREEVQNLLGEIGLLNNRINALSQIRLEDEDSIFALIAPDRGELREAQELLVQLEANLASVENRIRQTEEAQEGLSDSEFAESTRRLTESLQEQIFELENGSEQAELYAAALATGVESIDDLDPAIRRLIERVAELRQEQSQESAFARQLRQDQRESEAFVRQLERDYDRRVRAERTLSASLQQQILELEEGERAALSWNAAHRLGLETIEELPESIQRQIDQLLRLREVTEQAADEQRRLEQEAERAARESEQAYDRMVDSVTDGFEELFRSGLNGFDDFADSVVNIIERMVVRMLAEIATAQLAEAIDLRALTSQQGGAGGLGALGQQGGVLGAIGQALPQVALATAVFEAGRAISEALGGNGTIGGLFGGLVGAAFGGDFETRGAGLQFGVRGGAFSGENFENQRRSGGLFSSSRSRTLTSALDAEVEAAFNQTFENISTTVVSGLQTLGFNVADNALEGFNSAIRQIEFGDDQAANQAAVEAYFASLSDEVAAFAQGGGTQDFARSVIDLIESGLSPEEAIESVAQLRNESLLTFEQIQQLSGALSATNTVFEQLGIDAFEASVRGGELSQQLIELSGGIEAFATNSANFANTFVDTRTNAERLTDVFGELGLELPNTAESLVALVQGLDLTSEEGQRAFAVITALTDSLAQFYNEQERAAQEAVDAAERALRAAIDAERERADEVLRIETEAHNARIELINEQRELANQQLQETRDSVSEQLNLIRQQRSEVTDAFNALNSDLTTVQGLLRRSFSAEIDRIQTTANLRVEALNEEIIAVQDAANQRLDSINAERSLLSDSVNSLTSLANRLRQAAGLGQVSVSDALGAARRGDFSLAERVDTSALDSQGFASVADQVFANAVRQLQIGEIADLAGEQVSEFERQLAALNAQTSTVQAGSDATVAALQQQIELEQNNAQTQIDALNEQLNLLLGIDTSTTSVEEAIRQTQAAQQAIDEFGYENQIAALDAQTEALNQRLEDAEMQHEQTLEELERQVTLSEQQLQQAIDAHEAELARLDAILNEALGLNEAVLSVEEAIRQLNEAIQALAEAQGDGSSGQSVPSAPPGSEEANMNRDMMTELRSIRDEIRAGNVQIGRNTNNTANRLQNIELNGLDTRQVTA